jgi:membrane protease subunit (stomatin/prohibitin family)
MARIADIIKYEGDNSTFVWKHPSEDFNTFSQLIVHQSQEAIFFLNGEALDLFGAGRYTLNTQNIPLLSKILNLPTGGETPFHCEVYFINKTEQMAVKWGTDSKIQFIEPNYRFPIQIGASGEMSLRAEDSRRLLVKLVGTESLLEQQKLVTYFRAFLNTRVKAYLAQTIRERQINIFEIDERLNELSEELRVRLFDDFLDYGVALERFFVTTVVKPDGDPSYEKFKELHFRQYADIAEANLRRSVGVIDERTHAQKTVIAAEAAAQKRSIEGYTYQQERGFDVAETAAQNEGAGNFSAAGIGLGMMAGVGGAVGSAVGGIFGDVLGAVGESPKTDDKPDMFCASCGAKILDGAVFCDECGAPLMAKSACRECGYVFEREGKYCPKCGAKREGTEL